MKSATSSECCQAFMSWVSRFGVPRIAISDNGNSFVANLYRDIMKTFNIEVRFTPAYHAASNGALERRHQTIKNALKASLVDMGNKHQDQWHKALPWVLLGKRSAFQPDLDSSAALLAFGRSPELPGQLLGHPGPPLTTLETKALLEQLYLLDTKKAIPTTSVTNPADLSHTERATHVYVKVAEPRGLSARFEGPYKIISRPSRSQVQVRVGSYADSTPRLLTFHWDSCKIAHLRDGAPEGSRENLGRKPRPEPTTAQSLLARNLKNQQPVDVAQPQEVINHATSSRPVRSTRNNNPKYVDAVVPA